VLRRARFGELVDRQLDLFEEDSRALLAETAEAEKTWTGATREESEELYGDYQLLVDEIGERLLDLRETYAGTLDERTADEYRSAFNKATRKRFGRDQATLLEES